MSDVVHVPTYNFRREIPEEHRASLDTRVRWLWNQRFGTIQQIYQHSADLDDRTVASLFINAIWHKDLDSVALIFLDWRAVRSVTRSSWLAPISVSDLRQSSIVSEVVCRRHLPERGVYELGSRFPAPAADATVLCSGAPHRR